MAGPYSSSIDDYPALSTPELTQLLNRPDVALIDTRPVAAYNGWRLRNEPRGGHIVGARSLPAKWASYIDWIEIVRDKGIMPDQRIVIYGYDPSELDEVAKRFDRAGFPHVNLYTHFTDEWSATPDLPMDLLERYKHLVYPEWLAELQQTGNAPEYEGERCVVCHAHYRNQEDYREGHIPGAVELDTLWLESPETWNRRSSEGLNETLTRLGITHDTTVILYGRFSFPNNDDPFPGSSAGHLGSIRCAAIMLYAGVKDVRVLNGGLQAWLDAGYSITTEPVKPDPVREFGATIPGQPGLMVDTPEAKDIIGTADKNLVSIRSWPEYIGEVSGYNYIEKKGRIPGSVFGNCGSDAYHMENYRNLDHTTREFHEIVREWAEVGVTPDKHNAFYCGTGWRGSEAFFNAWLLGWPRVSVYDGGWFEWSNDGSNPFETGIPEGWTENGQLIK